VKAHPDTPGKQQQQQQQGRWRIPGCSSSCTHGYAVAGVSMECALQLDVSESLFGAAAGVHADVCAVELTTRQAGVCAAKARASIARVQLSAKLWGRVRPTAYAVCASTRVCVWHRRPAVRRRGTHNP
jgi:hypothetical protein